ncbi:MAG: hypothetical protein QOJ50_4, partial [Cryptosporangiaceae bacterium]|nr:hypothetical protein [Cryptosporangiaceae bacterium]
MIRVRRAPAVLAVIALAAVAACGQQGDGPRGSAPVIRRSLPSAAALSDDELAGQLL